MTSNERSEEVQFLHAIFLNTQRIYDVQIALLYAADPLAAKKLETVHGNFEHVSDFPFRTDDD